MTPNMKARISLLHKTESEWAELPGFKPCSGEIVLYDPDQNHQFVRLKVGDGQTLLKDLPFIVDDVIDGGRIR